MLQHHACFSFCLRTAYQEITLQSSLNSFKMPLLLPTAELKQPRLIASLLMIYTTVLTVVLFSQGMYGILCKRFIFLFNLWVLISYKFAHLFVIASKPQKKHVLSPLASGAAILLTIYTNNSLHRIYVKGHMLDQPGLKPFGSYV